MTNVWQYLDILLYILCNSKIFKVSVKRTLQWKEH